ncbi:Na/Pi cotransporter family protein [Microvirga sp. W0021]|uniref:Na/Pi cotransporter family protein n=1 Tax=Hohaiivirga grylli TaxID=3133970 RepID=A0ABV0BGD0_9HYPH
MSSTLVLINLLGACALLIWGLRMVKTGVTRAFGSRLRRWLALGTQNRLIAFFAGLLATLMIQSSTATALMAASFASQQMISSAMGQAIMLGANVGTSLVTQILSLNLGWLSPLLILAGVVTFQSNESSKYHAIGRALIGLGLMLLSLHLLGDATTPIRDSAVMRNLLSALDAAPIVAVIIAAGLAMIASSSLAVILFIMSLASGNIISPAIALALVLGANLGGAIPPYLATVAGGALAKRITIGNIIVRFVGVIAVMAFLTPLSQLFSGWIPNTASMVIEAHVALNVILAIVFLPLIGPLSRLTARFLPEPKITEVGPRYLDNSAINTPAVALSCAARETLRIGDQIEVMIQTSWEAMRTGNLKLCNTINKQENLVDTLYKAVKIYLVDIGREGLDKDDSKRSAEIMSYAINLEHIGDILQRGLTDIVAKKIKQQVWFSDAGFKEIGQMYELTIENFRIAQGIFVSRDSNLAHQLLDTKAEVHDLERSSYEHHLLRLQEGKPETLQSSTLHLDVLRDLRRINAHIRSVAYPILDEKPEQISSEEET